LAAAATAGVAAGATGLWAEAAAVVGAVVVAVAASGFFVASLACSKPSTKAVATLLASEDVNENNDIKHRLVNK
jgi:hypothetical protein